MSLREILLVLFLLSAIALISTGVGLILGLGAALIVTGVGVGALGVLMLVEVDEDAP